MRSVGICQTTTRPEDPSLGFAATGVNLKRFWTATSEEATILRKTRLIVVEEAYETINDCVTIVTEPWMEEWGQQYFLEYDGAGIMLAVMRMLPVNLEIG